MKRLRPQAFRPLLFVTAAVSAVAVAAPAAAATEQRIVITGADASVYAAAPSANFGLARTLELRARPAVRTYLRFRVTGLPEGTIVRATLKLFSRTGSLRGYRVRRTGTGWRERRITFRNAPRAFASRATSGRFRARRWASAEVTPMVTGNGVVAFALSTGAKRALRFASGEARRGLRPRLVIVVALRENCAAGRELSFTPAADAYVSSFAPDANRGAARTLRVRVASGGAPGWSTYLRFRVSGFITGPPAAARLRLFVIDPASDGGDVYAVGSGWTETGITWNNAPAPAGPALANAGAAVRDTWKEIPLPASAFVTGDGVYSFVLKSDNLLGGTAWYSSREGAAVPQLVLNCPGL